MTREVVSKVGWAGARSAYRGASDDLRILAGVEVSPAEFARVVLEEGARVAALQEERGERWCEPVSSERTVSAPETQSDRLVVEADATAVLTLSNEDHKMVYCARGYEAGLRYEKSGHRSIAGVSRYAASGESMTEFSHAVDALANRMGARKAKAIAFLADGAPSLWKMAEERLPGAVMIQDFWHVSEHLFDLARTLHGEGKPEVKKSGTRWKEMLYEGKVEKIIEELEALHKTHRGEKRKKLAEEIRYLDNGRHRMDYPSYVAAGWPVGSGAVEATCKSLIKERLCVTGARWKRANIPAIVALRLCRANDEWEKDFPQVARAA